MSPVLKNGHSLCEAEEVFKTCLAPSSVGREHDIMWLIAANGLALVYVS